MANCCVTVSPTTIGGATPGGTWVATTLPSSPLNFPAFANNGSCSGTTNVSVTQGNQIGTGDTFSFDPDTMPTGNYVFTYTVGAPGCEVTQTFTLTLNAPPTNGSNATGGNECSNGSSGTADIWACIGCTGVCATTGYWVVTTPNGTVFPNVGPGAGSITFAAPHGNGSTTTFTWTPATPSAIFNPNGAAAGNWLFKYVLVGSSTGTCDNCMTMATCTVPVVEAPNAGNPGTATACN